MCEYTACFQGVLMQLCGDKEMAWPTMHIIQQPVSWVQKKTKQKKKNFFSFIVFFVEIKCKNSPQLFHFPQYLCVPACLRACVCVCEGTNCLF